MSKLPQGWADARLGDVCLVFESRDPGWNPDAEFTYVDIGAIDNKTQTIAAPKRMLGADAPSRARRVIKADDVLFSTVRTYLKNIAMVPQELDGAFTSTGIAVLRAGDGIEPRYLFNWVTSDEFITEISKSQDGTLYPAVTDKDLFEAGIRLAPVPEQRRIVTKVDGLTARTARARKELDRIPTLIARYKQRLLALAAEGLLTRNWRDEKCGKAWMTTTVAGLAETTFDGPFGSNLKSADYVDSGVRVVRLENIGSLRFIREKETYITEAKFKSLQRHELKPDDVLFSSFIAEEIRVCLLPDDLETVAINKADCFCVRVDRSKCLPEFLAYRLASPTCYEVLKDAVHGATRPRISLSHLKQFEIELPPLEEQAEIVRRIESAFGWLDRMSADHAAAARLLPKLDAAILAKAFRGELVPQDPNDEPASVLLEQLELRRQSLGDATKVRRGRKPKGSKAQSMAEKPLAARERLLKDSEKWPAVGLPFEAIAMRSAMPHDALRDALFELLSGPSPALRQRFDTDAEVMVIQRVAA